MRIKSLLLILLCRFIWLNGNASDKVTTSSKPNVLIIHCDQLSKWPLSCYADKLTGYKDLDAPPSSTPNIDKLADNGVMMHNFFCNSGVCTPSRASLQTGRYPDATGAYENEIPMNLNERTLADAFNDEGYTSAYIGKWHLFGNGNKKNPIAAGWSHPPFQSKEPDVPYVRFGYNDMTYRYNASHFKYLDFIDRSGPPYEDYDLVGQNDNTYPTNVFADKAIDFIKDQGNNPYFLMLSIPDPHGPDKLREDYSGRNTEEAQYVPPTVTDDALSKVKRKRKKYCNMVSLIDDKVGDIIDAVNETNPNTIIIFTSDHGDYMGEYGEFGKNLMYSSANNIPFLIQWPGHIPAGVEIEEVASNVDIFPTLMGLIKGDMRASNPIHGDDFSHILLGEQGQWKDEAIIYHSSQQFAGIVNREYYLWVSNNDDSAIADKWYMERNALFVRDGSWEKKETNLFNSPEYQALKETLINRINYFNKRDDAGASKWLLKQYGEPTVPTRIENSEVRAGDSSVISMEQNIPNPATASTIINYSLYKEGQVQLLLLNILNQEVELLVNEYQSIGNYSVEVNCNKINNGIYLYTLLQGQNRISKKMLVVR
ncbi:sulfatase-like hydrolase/transferase [Carboxylicivirga sp. RSCT41]|uniref:sulfatase-like hydrolase/transferase n=1 Tax=Carboxylicivirga agarovorans TaxID=3417570 RepID=UPI003D3567C9